jgi:hypothetical protein
VDVGDRRLDHAEHETGGEGPERRPEAHRQRRDEALQPEQRAGVGIDRLAGGRGDRSHHRDRANQRERERDEQLDRDADDARALPIVRDRAQRAAVARPLEEPRRAERQRNRQPRHEEGARLHLRPAEVDVPRRADAVEGQRVRKDVARALEGRADHRPDREGDGSGPRDPADRRAAAQIGLYEPDVGARTGEHADR